MPLLEFTDKGIFCRQADVYLDPWKPVKKAIITHAHGDHAYTGHDHYLCTNESRPVLAYRLNTTSPIEAKSYGEIITINGVSFSFHPAGHIIGSAQIRVEHKGEVWVFSGDYKTENDGLCAPIEPITCHTFITESTFGLPVYAWKAQHDIFIDINDWWKKNNDDDVVSIISCYSLGKAQRIVRNIDASIGKIFTHGAIENINRVMREQKISLPETVQITKETKKSEWKNGLILCPPSAIGSSWMRKFNPYSLGIASGWMSLRGARRRRGADRGFALSDHADWHGLNSVIKATGASQIYATHGYTEIFAKWLSQQGLDAHAVRTTYEGELAEITASDESIESTE